jgi:hypothetical protein
MIGAIIRTLTLHGVATVPTFKHDASISDVAACIEDAAPASVVAMFVAAELLSGIDVMMRLKFGP